MLIIRNSVFVSLIINRLAIKPRTNISNPHLNRRDSVNFRMDRATSEGEVNLGVVNITIDGRKMLKNNVEEAGDVESE